MSISFTDIAAAADRLFGVAHRTPVLTSTTVNQRTRSQVFFKCENFQRAGSFKFRGAYNAIAQLSDDQRKQGVLAYSSGNHAQALALAGQIWEVPVTIVMPSDAPAVKQAATKEYGATIVFYDPLELGGANRALQKREEVANEIAIKHQFTLIPPFDYAPVIAGQGTAAKELIEEVGKLDILLVCVGGGGLISGSAIAAKSLSPNCQVIGVEPKRADDATRSFNTRTLQRVEHPTTIADGARSHSLGQLTFPLILEYVDDMVTVSDAAILRSMFFLWERLKIVVEPTGALAATALLEGIVSVPNAKIGVILSGGNVDLKEAGKLFAKATAKEKHQLRRPLAQELS
ncbi:threo-3-hydroxy-L-aspartate ammonia-lyase [Myxacorys almedinensis]|uniref:Threo-3-hydroxy-L-aspartate ammonia-lyase n=1 Tax=Myxacorys almedinensis A TaxID=2690445 RepID=A0A8J7Z058_9CYAN|nr:threo-3-hydroxy-L-aspartate ammonia-lyase [Myxacorys almedinensis]NDJ17722.1 threo-3-hydroxy-L-aspartate ammonia-lyase [Myxacorys almedinensis A]